MRSIVTRNYSYYRRVQRVRVVRCRGEGPFLEALPAKRTLYGGKLSNETSEESNETSEESNHKSEEFGLSSLGIEEFLPWNRRVPPLELKSSSVGTKKFQEGNCFWNSHVIRKQDDTSATHFEIVEKAHELT